ncbi:hypothetical protein LTR08_001540 [Meristemomyces frigidus]|nr:hypothetical protein LTR08_001540 [Meristemomyces frigidus]
MPLNLDYHELSSSSIPPETDAARFTDTSFSLMTYYGMTCQHKLAEVDASASAHSSDFDHTAIWDRKVRILAVFEQHVVKLSQASPNPETPHQCFTVSCAEQILRVMKLLLRRPIYKIAYVAPPIDDDFDTMAVATELLEHSSGKQSRTELHPWEWYDWVPWFALAIVLAELCSRPRGAATDHAWSVAEESYLKYAQKVADGDEGLLWKPIARLLRKVKATRASSAPDTTEHPKSSVTAPYGYTEQSFVFDDDLSMALNDFNLQSTTESSQIPQTIGYDAGDGIDPVTGLPTFSDQDFAEAAAGGLLDTGEGMSWFNWESFIDDVNRQGDN